MMVAPASFLLDGIFNSLGEIPGLPHVSCEIEERFLLNGILSDRADKKEHH